MKAVLTIVGVLAMLVGLLWVAQGTGLFPYPASSFMIGQKSWTYWGLLLAAAGTVLLVVGRQRR